MPSTTLDEAIEKARQLPPEDQERIGRELSDYIDHLRALRSDIRSGLRSLDAGQGRSIDIEDLIARARATRAGNRARLVAGSRNRSPIDLGLGCVRYFSRGAADAHLRDIHRAVANLTKFPHAAVARDHIVPGIRSIVLHPTVVFYRIERASIHIVRVVDGRRNLAALFPRDEGA